MSQFSKYLIAIYFVIFASTLELFANELSDYKNKLTSINKDERAEAVFSELIALANNGNVHAMVDLGMMHLIGDQVELDVDKSIQLFTNAAGKNNALAARNLSAIYANIEHLKNQKLENHWLKKAAELGDTLAQSSFGYKLISGQGVEKNIERGIYWTQKAAEKDDVVALMNLGYFFQGVNGVEKDLNKSINYYEEAGALGNEKAQLYAAKLYLRKTEDREQSTTKAIKYLENLGKKGDPEAAFELSVVYGTNLWTLPDDQKSKDWLVKAANLGLPKAQIMLGMQLIEGKEGVFDKNPVEAEIWIERGTKQNGREEFERYFTALVEFEKLIKE